MKKKNFTAATLTASVQYYDYHLYGFLAASLSAHFFCSGDNISQLIKAYFVFFLSYLAKPLGAIVIGRLGDIYGRSIALNISLIGTATASLIIALIPGCATIGISAAVILLFARMIICALVSSGTDGVRIYIFEQIPEKHRCLGMGIVTCATQIGSFFAAFSAWFFTLGFMPDFSWRFAFIIGSLLGILVFLYRRAFVESESASPKADEELYNIYKDSSILSIICKNWHIFAVAIIMAGAIGSVYQFIIIFFGTYVFEVLQIVDKSSMKLYTTIAIIIYMIGSLLAGFIADIYGRYKILYISCILLIISSGLMAFLLEHKSFSAILYFIIVLLLPFITMPALALLKQGLPKVIRYRIFSLSHAIGSILFSATTPLVGVQLYSITGSSTAPLIYFVTMTTMISVLIGVLKYKKLL